ncbi:DUF1189 domain-containing protein [Robertmurraya sp. DFI.2.37]|uniref:DUF1189 domain-containing protein n=1 Tax=Robertmurraya sp. DFI.2.37 TaxID=3031819 RepID=UPI0012478883|nr:DUF1189 domain-containing protein [Robertmurraya sp. DFI.2.37]MDF1508348.1 DUF1189 domain-containing protein [Robertmurraya sp. DFI.2.37]
MNIFKQLILSIYSPKSIASWRHQGIGKTILFVFLLVLISIIPTSIQISTDIVNGFNVVEQSIDKDIPDFTIADGELISDHDSPVKIEHPDLTVIFDSTGETELNDLDLSINTIALLKNDFAIIIPGSTTDHFSYSTMDIALTKGDIANFVNSIDSLLAIAIPILIIFIFLFASAMKFIGISVLALIGIMIYRKGEELKYRHMWRMAAYSIVLPTIFFMIMDIFRTVVPYGFMLNWLVSILVLFLALKEIPPAKEAEL